MERRQKDTGIAEVQIDDVGLLDVIDAYTCQRIRLSERTRPVERNPIADLSSV